MKGARILLIEDEPVIRDQLARVLRREGATVTEAGDGSDGLAMLARSEFDMVIADVCMPRVGGFGVFAAIRFGDSSSEPPTEPSELPVVLLSGHLSSEEVARGIDAGVDEFLQKPFDHEEFRARIDAVLRRARARAQPASRTHGSLVDLSPSALIQALHLGGRSGRLQLISGQDRGILDFQMGTIVHAEFEGPGLQETGRPAAMQCLSLEHGTFEVLPIPATTTRNVFDETQVILLHAAMEHDAQNTDSLADVQAEIDAIATQLAPEPDDDGFVNVDLDELADTGLNFRVSDTGALDGDDPHRSGDTETEVDPPRFLQDEPATGPVPNFSIKPYGARSGARRRSRSSQTFE